MGATDDGTFVAVARFESAEAARRNADRPEQGRWWEETSRLFDGEVTFSDSEDVTVDLQGDPDQAGFVQVMQGRVTDADRAKEVMARIPSDVMAAYRPDVLGSVMIGHAGRRVDPGHLLHLGVRCPRGRAQGPTGGAPGRHGRDG